MNSAAILLSLGAILLLGLMADFIGKKTALPRISLLLFVGIIAGEHGLGLLSVALIQQFPLITDVALLLVGFLLGGQFHLKQFSSESRPLLWISGAAAIITTLIVTSALLFFNMPAPIAFILGCIAAATAPAPIVDVILQSKTDSRFSHLLLRVVAIDDVWAMLLFSVGLAAMQLMINGGNITGPLMEGGIELVGGALLGVLMGLPAAYITGRLKPGQPTLLEALGLVLICGGIAIWFNLSFLLAVMVMGAVIVNLAKHHDYPFHEIENIEWPVMMFFFVIAGASLDLTSIYSLGVTGLIYIVGRTIGKIAGAWLGGSIGNVNASTKNWIGVAMLPHAGVPIGMALIAANQFPQYKQLLLSVIIGATIFFELVGPPLTRLAITKTQAPSLNR